MLLASSVKCRDQELPCETHRIVSKVPKRVSDVSRQTAKGFTCAEVDLGSTRFESDLGKIKSLFSNE